jgi:two-component system, NtrC family, response regulator HydG
MTHGQRAGSQFVLEPTRENLVGRGLDCHVVLNDPQCSRVHAIFLYQDGKWWISDTESRNGTFVGGERITRQVLTDKAQIRVGSSTFIFGLTEASLVDPASPPTRESTRQSVIREQIPSPGSTREFAREVFAQQKSTDDIYQIFELGIRLIDDEGPETIVQTCLSSLLQRTHATGAQFLWRGDDGRLVPQLCIPPDVMPEMRLPESILSQVASSGTSLHVDHHTTDGPSKKSDGDSLCVALVDEQRVIGAIHIYLAQGKFPTQTLQVAQTIANMLVRALVRSRKHSSLISEHERLLNSLGETHEMIGESASMQELKRRIKRIANATGCVLVRGESGAGKELVARALHKSSPRYDRPLLSVNCAAIPRELMESQLFGHKKGSFTGADSDHIGWFQQADLGTLFLDEVGELSLEGQAKLLRILENHPFLPVGGLREISVDVRVICATNRDLREFVAEKRFREDLYYRLSVFEVVVPPLRERGADISLMLEHFLNHFKKRHGRPYLQLSAAARTKLLSYSWPGNIRQLRNMIDSAVVMADGLQIEVADLGLRESASNRFESLRIDHWERQLISEALKRSEGNVQSAASMLGIARATLYRKIEEYGIKRD